LKPGVTAAQARFQAFAERPHIEALPTVHPAVSGDFDVCLGRLNAASSEEYDG
jgi:hypothetical protein